MKHSKEQLNEGVGSLLTYATDLVMAFRIIKILFQDFDKTKAFALGIIDADGNRIKKPIGLEEKSAYSPFIRLVFKMKRLIALVPGGKSKLGSMAAAFVMLREDEIQNITESEWDEILEDSPINSTSGVEGPEKPIGMLRRNWKDMDCFAGCHVFDVEGQTFSKYKRAKEKFERWENFISDEDGEQGKEIIKFSKTYPSRGIILKEKGTGAHVILKTPKK